MIIYELLANDIPYSEENKNILIIRKVLSGTNPNFQYFNNNNNNNIPNELIKLMECCWCTDYYNRPTANDIILILTDIKNNYIKENMNNYINNDNIELINMRTPLTPLQISNNNNNSVIHFISMETPNNEI